MVSAPTSSKLTDKLRILPEEILPDPVRQRLERFNEELDQLFFLDDTDELAIDRDTLIRIASNEELVPPGLRDIAILETAKHVGRRVKGIREGRRIAWREGEKYGMPIHLPTRAELRAMGISRTTTLDELGGILKAQFPEIPDFWMNDDPAQLAEMVTQNFIVNRTVWDCLVANLGWWAAIAIIGSIVIFVIVLASAGWQAALILAAIYFGFVTAYFILQCIANPEFQQR